jgi:hypothetical protein
LGHGGSLFERDPLWLDSKGSLGCTGEFREGAKAKLGQITKYLVAWLKARHVITDCHNDTCEI